MYVVVVGVVMGVEVVVAAGSCDSVPSPQAQPSSPTIVVVVVVVVVLVVVHDQHQLPSYERSMGRENNCRCVNV